MLSLNHSSLLTSVFPLNHSSLVTNVMPLNHSSLVTCVLPLNRLLLQTFDTGFLCVWCLKSGEHLDPFSPLSEKSAGRAVQNPDASLGEEILTPSDHGLRSTPEAASEFETSSDVDLLAFFKELFSMFGCHFRVTFIGHMRRPSIVNIDRLYNLAIVYQDGELQISTRLDCQGDSGCPSPRLRGTTARTAPFP